MQSSKSYKDNLEYKTIINKSMKLKVSDILHKPLKKCKTITWFNSNFIKLTSLNTLNAY